MTQSIPGLSHIDKDTELMKRSIQHAKTHNKTKTDRHENNKGLRDCHYCWCLTCSFCILERTIRLCQSNELHRASTNRTDGDLDRGEACQTQSDEKGETKIPPCFQTRRYISIMPPWQLSYIIQHSGILLLIGLWATAITLQRTSRHGSTLLTRPY